MTNRNLIYCVMFNNCLQHGAMSTGFHAGFDLPFSLRGDIQMTLRTLLPPLGCALLLTACASGGPATPVAAPVATFSNVMDEADVALKAGQTDKAFTILKRATGSFPAEKKPWLQLAQMKFDRASYGEAINNALEVLQRDPVNRMANSIVAVSGLRLSAKAIADLTRQNNLNGSLRSEARDLTKVLRTSLGEEVVLRPVISTRGKKGAGSKRVVAANVKAPLGVAGSAVALK